METQTVKTLENFLTEFNPEYKVGETLNSSILEKAIEGFIVKGNMTFYSKQFSSPTEPHVWGFVESFYPNYSSCDSIAYNDDLSKIVDGEINGYAEELFIDIYGQDTEKVKIDLEASNLDIFERAIDGYLEGNENFTRI